MAGISRVHGYAAAPSQRPSTISHYTLTFGANITTTAQTSTYWAGSSNTNNGYSDVGVTDGALDRIFRTAIPTVATVAMIGTVASNGLSVRFAIEDTGVDANSPGALGTGLVNGAAGSTSTAAALTSAVQALGTVNGIGLSSATVAVFAY